MFAEMKRIDQLINKYPSLEPCAQDIRRAYEILKNCFQQGGKLLVCGNGGSAADSEHIVGELMKGFLMKRRPPKAIRQKLSACYKADGRYLAEHLQGGLPAYSLSSQTALLTACANDIAADMVYAQQVYGYGKEGDVLWGISTSGRSKNVLYALQVAGALGLQRIGFTGQDGGKMKEICEAAVCVPSACTPEIQEMHIVIYHVLCAMLEEDFFADGEKDLPCLTWMGTV
jgi:D-sedoheptulose 7-phosphate isomerase